MESSSSSAAVLRFFPIRLYDMLEVAEENHWAEIVSWLPDGNGFCVRDRDRFVEEVLPNFFGHTKWKSFLRQINLYHFQRLRRGVGQTSAEVIYMHPSFVRGRRDQCFSIRRDPSAPSSPRSIKSHPSSRPHPKDQHFGASSVGLTDVASKGLLSSPQTSSSKEQRNRLDASTSGRRETMSATRGFHYEDEKLAQTYNSGYRGFTLPDIGPSGFRNELDLSSAALLSRPSKLLQSSLSSDEIDVIISIFLNNNTSSSGDEYAL